jgi:hypothetical protein
VTVIYNGSDTVTSCSYATPPDSTQRDEGFCPNPRGYIPLRAYGWSLTTLAVKVTLDHPQSEPQVGQQPDVAGPADAAQSCPTPLAMASHPPSEAGIGLRR